MSLRVVPVNWGDSCGFVDMWHRHLKPPRGYKFCLGVADDMNILVGVAIVGRPVARLSQDGLTLEVTRCATDGTRNAASMLYAACWQAARALGYRRLVTYNQEGETGASLRAAGYRVIAERPARPGWDAPSRPRDPSRYEAIPRTLWECGPPGVQPQPEARRSRGGPGPADDHAAGASPVNEDIAAL